MQVIFTDTASDNRNCYHTIYTNVVYMLQNHPAIDVRFMRGPLQSERLLNKQAHQSGLRPAVRILLKPHEKCRLGPSVLLNIYILQILLFLWLYFLSISLVGDTYHTPHPPPPWHWWMAPGPSPQRHRSISHGHTQIVDRAPVSQPATSWAGAPLLV